MLVSVYKSREIMTYQKESRTNRSERPSRPMRATRDQNGAPLKKRKKPTTIYVGNLSYQKTEKEIKKMFTPYGSVMFADIVTDSKTGQSKGIAFVKMPNDIHAKKAISEINGSVVDGRTLKVSIAQQREEFKNEYKAHEELEKERDAKPKKKNRHNGEQGLNALFSYLKNK
jgi:RNA recognition motif-containing protein